MNDVLNFLNTIAPIITIAAFVLLWYQIRSLKKIAPKEEEWAKNVQTLSKQFAELEENIGKGKFGDTQNVKQASLKKSTARRWN